MKCVISLLLVLAAFACLGCGGSESSEIDIYGGSTNVADIPQHIKDFEDNSQRGLVQARAMNALFQIGEPALPALHEALASDKVSVRLMALNTLGLFGPRAKEVLPGIQKATQDADATVQQRAKEVLEKVGG